MRIGYVTLSLALAGIGVGCSGELEPGQYGSCPLDCSEPVPAPFDMVIERMDPDLETTLMCPTVADGALQKWQAPIQVRFRAYRKLSSSSSSSSDESASSTDDMKDMIPLQGIGFEPWIEGLVDGESTNEEWRRQGDAGYYAEPGKFLGVETPSSEHCSDSCGVMTYEFRPTCLGGKKHDIIAGVLAGGAKVDSEKGSFRKITVDATADDTPE